jgi:hypothetical protein
VIAQAKTGRSTQAEHRFSERLSPLIAALGVTAVPNLLIRYQGRLQLTSNELIYVLHVLDHRRDESWPWVAVSSIVEATGAAERSVRDWRASLVEKGYLRLRARGRTGERGGGRQPDEHDLSQLFAALEALALEEQIQRAADRVRNGLPSPSFYRGLPSVPQLPRTDGRRLQTQRAQPALKNHADFRKVPRGPTLPVSAESTMPEPARSTLQKPAEEKEANKKRPLTQQHPGAVDGVLAEPGESYSGVLPSLATAALSPTSARPEELVAALYQELGIESRALTQTMYRRELAIARQLVAVGATPDEAVAYAREASGTTGRRGPIDMRAFERERATWLSRKLRAQLPALLRVANGRMPE